MQIFLSIALSLLLAWGCSHHARLRGRNPSTWFVAGAFFGLFALITLFILPVRKAQGAQEAASPLTPSLTPIAPEHSEKMWYFLDAEKIQFGPMSIHALGQAWQEGKVGQETYVWNENMENWQRFKTVITSAATS